MDAKLIESLRGKSREERMEYFQSHKSDLLNEELDKVNGGTGANPENPDSEGIYNGNYYTSWGYVCGDRIKC